MRSAKHVMLNKKQNSATIRYSACHLFSPLPHVGQVNIPFLQQSTCPRMTWSLLKMTDRHYYLHIFQTNPLPVLMMMWALGQWMLEPGPNQQLMNLQNGKACIDITYFCSPSNYYSSWVSLSLKEEQMYRFVFKENYKALFLNDLFLSKKQNRKVFWEIIPQSKEVLWRKYAPKDAVDLCRHEQ